MFTRTVKGGLRRNRTLRECCQLCRDSHDNLDPSVLTVFVRVKCVSDILPPCYLTVSQESQPNVILETRLHWLDWPSSILAKPAAVVKLYVFPINCWK